VTAALNVLNGRQAQLQRVLETGLQSASWPARLDLLGPGPLADIAGEGVEVWLDGGHNPAAAVVLAQSMADIEERVPRPLHLIMGMLKSKDAGSFFPHFKGLAEWVATVPIPGDHDAYTAEELARIAKDAGVDAHAAQDVPHALRLSRLRAGSPSRVLICGSLYLAGQVLALHGIEPK
jgi:dihydrofolate synthase/folylpolyglutamate synthase